MDMIRAFTFAFDCGFGDGLSRCPRASSIPTTIASPFKSTDRLCIPLRLGPRACCVDLTDTFRDRAPEGGRF